MKRFWLKLMGCLAPTPPRVYAGGSIRAELIRPDPDQPWVDLVEWRRDRSARRNR